MQRLRSKIEKLLLHFRRTEENDVVVEDVEKELEHSSIQEQLERELQDLNKNLEAEMKKQEEKSDEAAKKQNDELQKIKAEKIQLQHKIKHLRQWNASREKEVLQLKKEGRRLLALNQRQKLVLQRKTEEAAMATKRLKELLDSRKASSSGVGSNKGPGIPVLVQTTEHELEMFRNEGSGNMTSNSDKHAYGLRPKGSGSSTFLSSGAELLEDMDTSDDEQPNQENDEDSEWGHTIERKRIRKDCCTCTRASTCRCETNKCRNREASTKHNMSLHEEAEAETSHDLAAHGARSALFEKPANQNTLRKPLSDIGNDLGLSSVPKPARRKKRGRS